jgi:hypothetical protein
MWRSLQLRSCRVQGGGFSEVILTILPIDRVDDGQLQALTHSLKSLFFLDNAATGLRYNRV